MTTALTDTTPIPITPIPTTPNTSTPLSTAAASVPTAFTAPEDIRLFRAERSCLERYLPGLDAKLAEIPLLELEKPGNKGLALFRDAGGAGLLVGPEHGGLGASALDAVRIQRAIGTRSPSLAVATTMHHFSVASLAELSALNAGFEWAMLQAVAEQRWLVSSAFAEGRPGQHILSPGMRAERTDGGLLVSGVKRPCSLTWSMDVLSASVAVREPGADPDSPGRLAIILVPAASAGITRRPFWGSWVLAGAESDEVVLERVFVPDQLVFVPEQGARMDPVQTRGFLWFELLVAASYVGVASALIERVVAARRAGPLERAALCGELEAAMAALERLALCVDAGSSNAASATVSSGQGTASSGQAAAADGDAATNDDGTTDDDLLARTLAVRYAVERTLARVTTEAAALAGGLAFFGGSDIAYLLAAARPLAFHPPSAPAAAAALDGWFAGRPFRL